MGLPGFHLRSVQRPQLLLHVRDRTDSLAPARRQGRDSVKREVRTRTPCLGIHVPPCSSPPPPTSLQFTFPPSLPPSTHIEKEGVRAQLYEKITWYLPHALRQPVPPDWATAARHKGCPTGNPSPTRKGLVQRRLANLDKGTKTTRRGGGAAVQCFPISIPCVVTLPFQALRREWGWGRATGESESYTCPRGHVVSISEGKKTSAVRTLRYFSSGL